MEHVSFAPPARVVMPAVAKLLERRRKEAHSTVPNRSSQNGQLIKNDVLEKDDPDGKPTALTAKAKANVKKKVSPTRAQVPASDVASTATMASLRDVQKVVNEADRTNILPLTNATQLGQQSFKCSSKISDQSSSREPTKGYLNSALSSHSTVTQKSNHSAKFSKVSLDFSRNPHDRSVRSAPVATSPPKQVESPFEAFKSLSERWRAETAKDNLKNHSRSALTERFPGLEEWNDTLSFNTLGHGFVGGENHHDANVRSSHGEADSFIGTGAGLYLDRFSARSVPLPAKETLTTVRTNAPPTTAAAKTPPGFTPADARPFEARTAFERLRTGGEIASIASDGFGGSSLFARNLPLFGPPLPPNDDHSTLERARCIGSGRSRLFRTSNVPQDSTK